MPSITPATNGVSPSDPPRYSPVPASMIRLPRIVQFHTVTFVFTPTICCPPAGNPCIEVVRVAKRRCADVDGFSLHADVCVPARDRAQLERLCRYVARPAIASERPLAARRRSGAIPLQASLA